MKKIILITLLLLSVNSFSQSENLVDVTWQCTTIVINGNTIQAPSNEDVPSVLLDMHNENNPGSADFNTGVCNVLTSGDNVTYNDPELTFIISQLTQSLIGCDLTENSNFESSYFGFYYDNLNAILSYEITTIGDINTLTITASNGDIANYEASNLSIDENELKFVSIHPNPASETITISSEMDSIDRIEIYSIEGKILKSIEGSISSIDISYLSEGTYFLKLYSADNFITKQFVKK